MDPIGKSISEPEVRNAGPAAPSDSLKLEGKRAHSSVAAAAASRLFCTFLSISRSFAPHQTCRMLRKIHAKMPSLRNYVVFSYTVTIFENTRVE